MPPPFFTCRVGAHDLPAADATKSLSRESVSQILQRPDICRFFALLFSEYFAKIATG